MAFLFSSSHLPASRVRRPALEDDDHDENREAMPRSGGVRASSHLEGRVAEPETARSTGGSPAPRSSAAGIDWMARLKELAEQQQQRRRADSAAPDSGPRRTDGEHEPDAESNHDEDEAPWTEGDEAPEHEKHEESENTSSWYHPPESGSYHPDPDFNVRPNDAAPASPDHGFDQPAQSGRHGMGPNAPTDSGPAGGRTGAFPNSRLFEMRPHPALAKMPGAGEGYAQSMKGGQERAGSGIDDDAQPLAGTRNEFTSSFAALAGTSEKKQQGAGQSPTSQNSALMQQMQAENSGMQDTAPPGSSAVQEHNRVRLLDERDPGPPPRQRMDGTNSKNKPRDQYEKEKAAYEKAKAQAAANHAANERNRQTVNAWENYDRAIKLMEMTPEGGKILEHLRNDKNRVFKVVMVNDPIKDSYMGISIKPGAQGQYVNTGKKDEQGREIHVLFLSAPALARNAAKPNGQTDPDAEALEDVWHELYHASERHLSGTSDPLALGTTRNVDRLSQQQSSHERRAVRFENIIRARNGGVRMKNKYGGRYVKGPDGQTRIVDVINVPEAHPPWLAAPKQ